MVARSTTSGRRRRVQIVERRGYERSRLPGVWAVGSLAILSVVALPFVSLAVVALGGDGATWRHLFANVLPAATMTTLLLLVGVGAGTLVIGTATAWLIAVYRFPGARPAVLAAAAAAGDADLHHRLLLRRPAGFFRSAADSAGAG